jgi:hypothetical protein
MTALLKRSARRIVPMLLAATLFLSPAAIPSARAQDEFNPAGAGESKGDPIPWYLGAGLLSMVIIFCIGKSARR